MAYVEVCVRSGEHFIVSLHLAKLFYNQNSIITRHAFDFLCLHANTFGFDDIRPKNLCDQNDELRSFP
jgi:hypothetical protein